MHGLLDWHSLQSGGVRQANIFQVLRALGVVGEGARAGMTEGLADDATLPMTYASPLPQSIRVSSFSTWAL